MPAVPEWDVLLRGGVLRALSPRGCRSGWTVSNFRGRARLHITARAAGGHRRQLLLTYPWESDQLEAIRDGVVKLYGDFQAASHWRKPLPSSEQRHLSPAHQCPEPRSCSSVSSAVEMGPRELTGTS